MDTAYLSSFEDLSIRFDTNLFFEIFQSLLSNYLFLGNIDTQCILKESAFQNFWFETFLRYFLFKTMCFVLLSLSVILLGKEKVRFSLRKITSLNTCTHDLRISIWSTYQDPFCLHIFALISLGIFLLLLPFLCLLGDGKKKSTLGNINGKLNWK